ncbi:MAG: hypothetical protein AAGL97_15250 [Pseudomonadota bacterium]
MTEALHYLPLKTEVKLQYDLQLSERDEQAIAQMLAWEIIPTFISPGRTAWYKLLDPPMLENGTRLRSAKLKGVGCWSPVSEKHETEWPGIPRPKALCQPTNSEYAAGFKRLHFGISEDAAFCTVESEAAPFGGITHRRALLEYNSAKHLANEDVPSVIPYRLIDYPELDTFRGDSLSAVVTLAPCSSPTKLDYFLLGDHYVSDGERANIDDITKYFSSSDDKEKQLNEARLNIAIEIGELVRRMSASGLYRHASTWDNFLIDVESKVIFFSDLDSTRPLSELHEKSQGLQQLRDLASALYRLAGGLYRPIIMKSRSFSAIYKYDPFAGIVSGYFNLPLDVSRKLLGPIWRYFGSHFFLIQREIDRMDSMSYLERTSYTMDRDVFYGLVFSIFASQFRERGDEFNLKEIPDELTIEKNLAAHLGERETLLKLMVSSQ